MKLSVLIPVYNGARHLDSMLSMLRSLAAYKNGRFNSEAEIVLVNNCSTDDTGEIARSFQRVMPNLRVIDAEVHAPSTEQNVLRSFSFCRGEYVWTLGVDDNPICSTFDRLLDLVQEGRFDFMVFNNPIVDEFGQVLAMEQVRMSAEVYEAPIALLAQRLGMWFTLAGISNHVLRRSCIEHYDLASLIAKTSPIYSHVVAYLEVFTGKRAAVVSLPLVYYRLERGNVEAWRRGAERFNVCDEYFWTVGFLRQISYLERKGIVGPTFLAHLLDRNEARIFRPVDVMLSKTRDQLSAMIGGGDARNRFLPDDFEFLCSFLQERVPLVNNAVMALRDLYDAIRRSDGEREALSKAAKMIDAHAKLYLFASMFDRTILDFEVYRIGATYYAVHRSFKALLPVRMSYLGEEALEPVILVDSCLERLVERIKVNVRIPMLHHQAEKCGDSDEIKQLRGHIEAILNSTSWRITAPLRRLSILLRKLRRSVLSS